MMQFTASYFIKFYLTMNKILLNITGIIQGGPEFIDIGSSFEMIMYETCNYYGALRKPKFLHSEGI